MIFTRESLFDSSFFSQYFETKHTKKIIEKVRTKLVGEKLFNCLFFLSVKEIED